MIKRRRVFRIWIAAVFTVLLAVAQAQAALSLVESPSAGDFILFDGTRAAGLVVATNDEAAVMRAAGDLVTDVKRVTGV